LKDVGLRVAKDQPHLPPNRASPEAVGEPVLEPPDWQERNKARSAKIVNGSDAEAPQEPTARKPRQPRAKISATKPDGTIPVTLGGKLPPVSVLSRREFGLRALRR
jgi:hypothetical protein